MSIEDYERETIEDYLLEEEKRKETDFFGKTKRQLAMMVKDVNGFYEYIR